ncbi:MAG TPA: hypothetical protein VNZ68_00500 [Rhodocyclaceae bacterium]|nr:hypothetical protein [Rhodocyclaceae bacterium]
MTSFGLTLKFMLAALSSLFILSGNVHASPVLLKEIGLSSGLATGSLSLPASPSPLNYFAGLQNIQIDNDDVLLAYCIDPFQFSPTSNASYQVGNDFNAYFGADAADIGKLYSLFYTSTLGNNLNAAGFQLALWELIADGSKNLAAGLVKKTGSTNASIVSTAQSMLDALSGPAGSDSFIFTLYTSTSKQDYMVATLNANQVPEPQGIALMALALTLLSVVVRRQR